MSYKVALVDADSIIYFCLYNKKDVIPKTLEECKASLDGYIYKIIYTTEATHFILALTIGKNFRYSIKSDYKGGRSTEKPLYFNECREYLIDKYSAIHHSDLEADDLVNIYNKNIPSSFICACDSDILEGLEGSHFNYKKFEWIITSKEQANYKFWCSMITGTHNGISGLKGKGEVYAKKIFLGTGLTWKITHDNDLCRTRTFNEYIDFYKDESIAIEEFYRNYKCIKILDKYENLEIKAPIEYNRAQYIDNNVKEENIEEW